MRNGWVSNCMLVDLGHILLRLGTIDMPVSKRRVSNESVLDAAEKQISRGGIGALPLTDIAAQSEIRPPSLYTHIDSLEHLQRLLLLRACADQCVGAGCRPWQNTGRRSSGRGARCARLCAAEARAVCLSRHRKVRPDVTPLSDQLFLRENELPARARCSDCRQSHGFS